MYKIHIPPFADPCVELDKLSFNIEQEAINNLSEIFNNKRINFSMVELVGRKVFLNNQQEELASIVSIETLISQ